MPVRSVKPVSFVILCIVATLYTHAQSLTIINQNYELAKAESIKQGKLMIIDFYTSWCQPCKELDAAVFKDTAISNQIARQFIVLKYDAEKDSAHQLTLKHHVSMYPTTVVLNKQQRVVDRMYGTGTSDKGLASGYLEFLAKASANDAGNHYIKGVSASTLQNYPAFYKEYVYRVNTKETDKKIAEWWQTKPDPFSEVSFAVLSYFIGGTEEINTFFLQNRKKYEELYGELDVRFITSMMISQKLNMAIKTKDRIAFNAATQLAKENLPAEEAKNWLPSLEQRMLQQENRWPEALQIFNTRRNKQQVDEEATVRFCRQAADNCTDKEVLQTCTSWMKTSTDKEATYDNLDTYARLLYKTGDKQKSYTLMEQAIAAGKLAKENTTSSEKWLKETKQ